MTSSNTPETFPIAIEGGHVTARHYAATPPPVATLVFAHGAGSSQSHPAITTFMHALAERGIEGVTFDFPYREQGRKIPDRAPVLEQCYAAVIAQVRERLASARDQLFIGGRSMGGRMATQLAAQDAQLPIAGLVLLGYPLHPPGQPSKRRDAHLPQVGRPMLIVQGSRDTFGTPDEMRPVFEPLAPLATLHIVEGADHSLVVSRTASKQAPVNDAIRRVVVDWMTAITRADAATRPPQR